MLKITKSSTIALSLSFALGMALSSSVAAQLKDGGLRIALSGGLDRLDPARTANGTDLVVIGQIYDTLLKMDADGNLKPSVAKSYEAIDQNTWRFHLRDDVKFHDGTPLTAADVKFSIDRILDKAIGSVHAGQLGTITEVKAIDDHTVDVIMAGPDPQLPRRMQPYGGTGRVFIVSKSYVESNNPEAVSDKPLGSGPYKLTEWAKGQRVVLDKSPHYWGGTSDVKKATFTFIPENSTRVNALIQKEVDLIQRLPIADIDRIKANKDLQVIWSPNGLVHSIFMDCRTPPFDDVDVRKAFTESIDLESIITALLGEYGRVLPGILPPNVTQHNKALEAYKYNPDASQKFLQRKKIAPFSVNTSEGRYVADREIYQSIVAQAKAAGFQVNPRVMEWGRLIAMIQAGTGGPFNIVGYDYSEGDASKMHGFASSARPNQICPVPAYDEAANRAMIELDDAKRTELWRTAERALLESYKVAGTWQAASIYGARKQVDWKSNFGDNISLVDIKISQ